MRVSTSGSVRGASGRGRGGTSFFWDSATRIRSPVNSQLSTWSRGAAGSASSRVCCSAVNGRVGRASRGDERGGGGGGGGGAGGGHWDRTGGGRRGDKGRGARIG